MKNLTVSTSDQLGVHLLDERQENADARSARFAHDMLSSWPPLKQVRSHIFGNAEIEIVQRVSCVLIRKRLERGMKIRRLLLISPFGFSGTNASKLDPHPESRWTRAKILGGINAEKRGFSNPGRSVTYLYSTGRVLDEVDGSGAASFTSARCSAKRVAWKQWFYSYRENGEGFFHSFRSESPLWIAIIIEKRLTENNHVDFEKLRQELVMSVDPRTVELLARVQLRGSAVFDLDPSAVTELLRLDPRTTIPCFLKMLNIQETGRHENCTFFALLLKAAKTDPSYALREVSAAKKMHRAPSFYLDQLIQKISRLQPEAN